MDDLLCVDCGDDLESRWSFCPYCGAQVKEQEEEND
jgi:rRNA maturation endonuclease Nob1